MDEKKVIIIGSNDDVNKVAQNSIKQQKQLIITQHGSIPIPIINTINSAEILNDYTNNRASRRGHKNKKAWESKRYYK